MDSVSYKLVETEDEFKSLINKHNRESKFVVIDIETTGLDTFNDEIINVQLSGFVDGEVFITRGSIYSSLPDLSCIVVGHNIKFDITFLHRKGIDCTKWNFRDTLLLGHLVNENRESNSLDSYIKELFNDDYKEKFWEKYKTYQEAPETEGYLYAAKDVHYTKCLYKRLIHSLREENIPEALSEQTHRLQRALLKTEIVGIKIDFDYITELGVRLSSEIEALLPKIRELVKDEIELIELELWEKELAKRKTEAGKLKVEKPEFSFDSSRQIQSLLYDQLKLPTQFHPISKAISVDEGSLENLKGQHPVVEFLLQYRGLKKVLGTYIEGTLERVKNDRIYPEFRVAGTVTGRISHSNPNLGQLPKSGGVRGIYCPDEGKVFISADYSQLEVCIEANLTGDRALSRIFKEGLSKHDITARELSITRDQAKTLNFALQYWASHFKVAKLLGISLEKSKEIWDNYWRLYAGPKTLKSKIDGHVDSGIPLTNLVGRKRRFEVRKRNGWDSDYRQAYNFLIQSTGADITSQAFYRISEWLEATGYGRGLFTVHDEILIEVNKDVAEECETMLLYTMVSIGDDIGFKIPLKAESSGSMNRWLD